MRVLHMFLFGLMPVLAVAQPTLTQADGPAVGDEYLIITDTLTVANVLPGPDSANAIWKFSYLEVGEVDTVEVEAPSATPFAADFPTANAAIGVDDVYNFFDLQSNGVFDLGFGGQLDFDGTLVNAIVKFLPQTTVAPFPLHYLDAWNDTTQWHVGLSGNDIGFPVVDSIQLKRNQHRHNLVDGWGTLQLPADTVANTLRISRMVYTVDSIFIKSVILTGGNWVFADPSLIQMENPVYDTLSTYDFMAPDGGLPWLSFSLDTDGLVAGFFGIRYQATSIPEPDTAVGAAEAMPLFSALQVFPNPATTGVLNIQGTLHNPLATTVYYDLTDATGRLLKSGSWAAPQPAFAQHLDVHALSAGLYSLRLKAGGQQQVVRVVR